MYIHTHTVTENANAHSLYKQMQDMYTRRTKSRQSLHSEKADKHESHLKERVGKKERERGEENNDMGN